MNRRNFFVHSSVAVFSLPIAKSALASPQKLKLGLISDVHKDIIHDADERLNAFVKQMQEERADAILQMGDFCIPKPANLGFMEIWNRFSGPKYHTIGNHDTDGGFKRSDTVKYYGMPDRYYSFDLHGFHFVVLDANDVPDGHKGGYPSYIAEEQVQWLKADLEKTQLNTFIFSHQSLERAGCIRNQEDVRKVIAEARTKSGDRKVAACFNGHWHIDHARMIDDIPYVHINSASYIWLVDPKYRSARLSPELSKKFPYVSHTIPYTKPVFTTLEIDPQAGTFQLSARHSEWMGPGPEQIGYAPAAFDPQTLYPGIRARHWDLKSTTG